MNRLVYLSPVPWASFAQRPHKFAEWFHLRTGGEVLWIDPYPTRLPKWRDAYRLSGNISITCSSVPSWLQVIKPAALPVEPIFGAGLNRFLWKSSVEAVKNFLVRGATLLVVGKPSALAIDLLEQFNDLPSLYDAMDDFPAFQRGISKRSLSRSELKVVESVGAVWASSTKLKARWEALHHDVTLVLNGQDFSASQTLKAHRLKSDRRVFGYVGSIEHWFDWHWVIELANSQPEAIVRLIGPMHQPATKSLPENVEILPACAHPKALEAMCEFHVGLIPFKKNELTLSVDPVKYYEYRSLGLPVISTDFGEMSFRSQKEGVFISVSPKDIAMAAKGALEFSETAQQSEAFARSHSWSSRFDSTSILDTAECVGEERV